MGKMEPVITEVRKRSFAEFNSTFSRLRCTRILMQETKLVILEFQSNTLLQKKNSLRLKP